MPPTARTIVIVGGVAGGAGAAARARRVNEQARIILLEKDEHISFANCGLPYYIGGEITERQKLLLATPEKFRAWFNIDVRTGQEVRRIDRARRTVEVLERAAGRSYELAYDKLILAPGAAPIVPPIAGVDAANVFTLRNLADSDRLKQAAAGVPGGGPPRRAVVVGAGFIGLEMVEMFHRLKMQVALVERADQVLPPLDPEMARLVEQELLRQGVELHLGDGLQSLQVEDGQVRRVVLASGASLEADLVMLSIGIRPNVGLAQAAGLELGASGGIRVNAFMQTSDPAVYAVGDAVEYHHAVADLPLRVPLAGPANRAGRIAGEHAASDQSPPMPAVLGTSIVRVFGVTAAVTGCNSGCVERAGGQALALWAPGNHHVSYYPGAQEMLLKLLYEPGTGKVLGAQAVGGAGVDKRIDVLATAIALGGTVQDLADLDLAYAPPFGAAKDPIHQIAFAAQNQQRGLERFLPAGSLDGLPAEAQILDVRTAAEWNAGHLDRAVHIPLHELRGRLGELDRRRPVVVVCRGGQRSYYASRLLQQSGFVDVRTASGGMHVRQLAQRRDGQGAGAVRPA